MKHLYLTVLFLLSGLITVAQTETCPDIVGDAFAIVESICIDVGRNELCYGNPNVQTTLRDEMPPVQFERPGDRASLDAIQSISLSERISADSWGVALLALQADLPDTLPGQNVQMLLFGNTHLRVVEETQAAGIELLMQGNANVRSGPGTGYRVIDGVLRDTSIIAIGRNTPGDWLLVQLPEARGTGWIYSSNFTTAGDVMTLTVTAPAAEGNADSLDTDLQAFYFQSTILDSDCKAAPQEGILVQTPEGAGEVSILINEVRIDLGSTVVVQAVPDDAMIVTLQEGAARVSAQGVSVDIPVGATATIPLDADGLASGIPQLEGVEGIPLSGRWLMTYDIVSYSCGTPIGLVEFFERTETLIATGNSLLTSIMPADITFSRIAEGAYEGTGNWVRSDEDSRREITARFSLTVQSPTEIIGSRDDFWAATYTDGRSGTCAFTAGFTLTYAGEEADDNG